eukprot:CAMPEP_0197643078 /NCGR_PEP_ID=MMETSP1338-20131121/16533_1 /TAXON_ID=43686 ORGANISM="Pelagodinium beii, Strain RCC1491" /NCGR_SAMPLE_ID=MMETSP1338 /ASSEMBLY_ACC=CAM_ASM_000754 /LENGTH=39 /DNA_ID= /DNA_START= /DNA_END= /DNA_ORIENTATION=
MQGELKLEITGHTASPLHRPIAAAASLPQELICLVLEGL